MCADRKKCFWVTRLFSLFNLFFLLLFLKQGLKRPNVPLRALSTGKRLEKLLRTKISILSAGLGDSGNTLQRFPIVLNYLMSPSALHVWFYETPGGVHGEMLQRREIRPIELKTCPQALAAAIWCSEGVWSHGFQDLFTTLGCRTPLEVTSIWPEKTWGPSRSEM